jgi:hypothetical protein
VNSVVVCSGNPSTSRARRDARIDRQQRPDLLPVRGRASTGEAAAYRPAALTPECPPDRIAVVACAAGDLVDREPLDLAHPPDLRPSAHVQHFPPPRLSSTKRGSDRDRTRPTRPRGVRFQPAKWMSIQAARQPRPDDREEGQRDGARPASAAGPLVAPALIENLNQRPIDSSRSRLPPAPRPGACVEREPIQLRARNI